MSRWVPDLLVYVELPEDLGCVQEVLVLEDPATVSNFPRAKISLGSAHTSLRSKPTKASSG
jgi:hypothetical protein